MSPSSSALEFLLPSSNRGEQVEKDPAQPAERRIVRGPSASSLQSTHGLRSESHPGVGVARFPHHAASRLRLGTDTGCLALGQAEIQTR